MRHTTPAALVRFNLHIRRDHVARLTNLARTLSTRKGRDTRLGEALELVLMAGLSWSDVDLLDLAPVDRNAPHWPALGPIVRQPAVAR